MKISFQQSPELLGIFGFSWQEKVAANMLSTLKGSVYESKLKSFWGGSGLNTELINNLERAYLSLMAQGRKPVSFTTVPGLDGKGGQFTPETVSLSLKMNADTQIDGAIIDQFFRSIYILSRDGKIPFEKWNPQGYSEAEKLQKTFETEQGVLDKLKPAADTGKLVLLVAGVAAGAFLLNQMKGLTK